MKKLLSIILLALPVTVMAGNFTGNEIRISSEEWKADKDGNFSTITTGTDIRVKPFYDSGTDVHWFEMGTPGSGADHFWSIDFHMDGVDNIDLIFTNPSLSYPDYQYDYGYDTDLGFHFQDVDDTWRPIVGVTVSTPFAPKGFDPALIHFDENNIYVNLKGSSCVNSSCVNVNSPTGLNNTITLNVQFEGDPNVYRMEEIDLVFDWLEVNYRRYFPSHQESFYSDGYRARFYPSNLSYVTVKDLNIYSISFGKFTFGALYNTVEFGSLDTWLFYSGIEADLSRKKDARRKAAKEEKLRKEEEDRQAKIAWEEANRGPYDPYHEESDSYSEPLKSYGEPLD